MNVNILGAYYEFKTDDLNNPLLSNADGVCKIYDKQIIIRDTPYLNGIIDTDASREKRREIVIRHELIHAVAEECGVSYGDNEELVDWIAHIIPIVNDAYEKIYNYICAEKTGD